MKQRESAQIIPIRSSIVITRDLHGEVSLAIPENMTCHEAAFLLDEAMAYLPLEDDEDLDEEMDEDEL